MAIYHVRGGIGNQAALGREHDRHWPPIPFIAGLEPGHLGFRRVSFCNAFSSPGLPADIGARGGSSNGGQGTRPRIQRFYHDLLLAGPEDRSREGVRFYGLRTESHLRPRASPRGIPALFFSRDRTKLPFAASISLASRCHQSEISARGIAHLMTSRASESAIESCLISSSLLI
jgi:hypothetical protein